MRARSLAQLCQTQPTIPQLVHLWHFTWISDGPSALHLIFHVRHDSFDGQSLVRLLSTRGPGTPKSVPTVDNASESGLSFNVLAATASEKNNTTF